MNFFLIFFLLLAGLFCRGEWGQKYEEAPGVRPDFAQTLLRSIQRDVEKYKGLLSFEIPSESRINLLLGAPVSPEEKQENLEQIRAVIEQLQDTKSGFTSDEEPGGANEQSLEIFARLLKIRKPVLKMATDMNMLKVVKAFAHRARREDDQMTDADILQASRNVWTAAALQKILDLKVQLTDSLYGYSMLYPYTDNVFDDPSLDKLAKKKFVKNFGSLLLEKEMMDLSHHETKVAAMINAMYGQYPTKVFPDVQQAILSIYHAQVASVKQLESQVSEDEVLEISAFKGATSVLADAFLAKPDLSQDEFDLSIQFGIVLQLIDDLQDLMSDRTIGQKTLFSYPGKSPTNLDLEIVRMLDFSYESMLSKLKVKPHHALLGYTIFSFLRLLVFESVAKQSEAFTPEFVLLMEARSPIPFQELKNADIERHLYGVVERMKFN